MFNTIGKIRPQVKYKYWASLGHEGQTLADLILKMEELGNTVLEIDEDGNRILLARSQHEGEDQWGCRICLDENLALVIVNTEEELLNHYNDNHPGWDGN